MNTTLTSNINFLQNVNWRLTIQHPNFANLEYFCVGVNLPAITMTEIRRNYRNEQGYFPGDTLAYGPMTLKFVVDEDMANYVEALRWMLANQNQNQGTAIPRSQTDATLSILSAKNATNRRFRFINAFPSALGELTFNTQVTATEYLSCDLTLHFDRFEIDL